MEYGLYEKILSEELKKDIGNQEYKKTRHIDNSELSRVLSITYQKIIRETLSSIDKDTERIEFINNLNKTIGIADFEYENEKFKELLSVHHDKGSFNILNEYRPKTSISTSTLFTGNSGPTLESELSREIRTADEIDFLISFIKFSGLRLIYDDLVEFTKTKKLRVITTAYIGSSNLSNPALSNGLEWNLKISEYTSKDVIDSFKKTFESYWNDEVNHIGMMKNSKSLNQEMKKTGKN